MGLLSFIKNWFTVKEPEGKPRKFHYTTTGYNNNGKKVYIPMEPRSHKSKIYRIREVARVNGYTEIDLQENNKMISFKKDDIRINVYYTTMTVGTCLPHPKQGKTQLFRRNVSWELLNKLFAFPRAHTGVGYKQKGNHARA